MSSYIKITPEVSWWTSNSCFDELLELAAAGIHAANSGLAEKILGRRCHILGFGFFDASELSLEEYELLTCGIKTAYEKLKQKATLGEAYYIARVEFLVEILQAVKANPVIKAFLDRQRNELETVLGRPFSAHESTVLSLIRDPDDLPCIGYLRILGASEREVKFADAISCAKRRQDNRQSATRHKTQL